jgi:carboxymethylenebutenolidase
VLVLHPWWGLTASMRGACDRLADEGFVALAPDLYRGRLASSEEEAQAQRRKARAASYAVTGALDRLRRDSGGGPVGVVGFSMGAHWALWLAQHRADDVAAVVLFYGARGGQFALCRAAVQGHFAGNDPWTPPDAVRRLERDLRRAGHTVELHQYPGTGHWFCEPDQPAVYDVPSAARAWQRTLAFLDARLRVGG